MYKLKKQVLLIGILVGHVLAGSSVEAALPNPNIIGSGDAGVQLNRTREYLERTRVANQIAEDRAKQRASVDGQSVDAGQQATSSVKFELKKIELNKPSDILSTAELDTLTKPYIGKQVSIQDLYELVADINKLYSEKGYLTCRATLPPQTIKQGSVMIDLIEGKTGNVNIENNKTTKDYYIKNRIHLKKGNIDNINALNKDLLRFNATNDVQLRISMQAGADPGTTDYVITAYEPQRHVWTVYSDNAGSESSGELRAGLFFADRSLTGERDSLNITSMFTEGSTAVGVSYNRPVGRSGTKLNVMYNTNNVHIINGMLADLNVRGSSYSWSLGLTQPLVVTEKIRTEASLEYNHQNSKNDFLGIPWTNDTINEVTAAYSSTNYGDSYILYQRHGYTAGSSCNISGESTSYSKYNLNSFYQKVYAHRQMISMRLDAQIGGNNYMPSSRQFYIGGANSVRGYKESLLSGDHGYALGLEYSIPVFNKQTAVYLFFDHGAVFGSSAFNNNKLSSVGFGIKSTIRKNIYTNITLGFPLNKTVNDVELHSARVSFMFSGQF